MLRDTNANILEYLTSAILNKIINWKQYGAVRFLSDYVMQLVIRVFVLCGTHTSIIVA